MIKIFWTHHLHVWTDSCSLMMSSRAAAGVCNGHIYFACAGYPQYSFWYVNHITHTTSAYHANPEFNEKAHSICKYIIVFCVDQRYVAQLSSDIAGLLSYSMQFVIMAVGILLVLLLPFHSKDNNCLWHSCTGAYIKTVFAMERGS